MEIDYSPVLRETRVTKKTEIHLFQEYRKDILFDVERGLFFEIDEVTKDVLRLCDGRTPDEIVTAIDKKYEETEIIEAMNELEQLEIVTGDRNQIQSGLPPIEKMPALRSLNVILHVTDNCNLSCEYCFVNDACAERHMSKSVAQRAVLWMLEESRGGRCHINFFGGEPLLNFKLIKHIVPYSIKKAKEHDVDLSFGLTTNGTLLKDDIIQYLLKREVSIMVSIDGPEHIHDRMRRFKNGKGSHNLVEDSVNKLYKLQKGKVSLRATYTACNIDLKEIYSYLQSLGDSQAVAISPVSLPPDSEYALTHNHIEELKGRLRELGWYYLQAKERKKGHIVQLSQFETLILQLMSANKKCIGCGGGYKLFSVACDGGIYFCHRFSGMPEYKLGDVFSGVDRDKQKSFLNKLIIQNRTSCQGCWARYLCGGGCYHEAYTATGDVTIPNEVSCELIKLMYQIAMAMCIIREDSKWVSE